MWLSNGRSPAWREATDRASLAEKDASNLKPNLDAGLQLVDGQREEISAESLQYFVARGFLND